jgi:hypothetical protein
LRCDACATVAPPRYPPASLELWWASDTRAATGSRTRSLGACLAVVSSVPCRPPRAARRYAAQVDAARWDDADDLAGLPP